MTITKTSIFALFAAVFTGCTVGPDYHSPSTTMPARWAPPMAMAASAPSQTVAKSHEVADWWKTFGDPVLDKLVAEAVSGNLTLQQAEARIRQARASRGVTEAAWWPDLNATADYRRTRTPNGQGGGIEANQYRAGFDSVWELDVFGATSRAVEASDANIIAAVEDRRNVLVTLLGDVALNYIDLRGAQERIKLAQNNLLTQQRTLDVTRRQFAGGFVAGLDVANAEAQVASTRSIIPGLESQARQDIYALAVLLGREPGALIEQLTPSAPIPTTPPEVPVGLPSELLRRRPDIRRAEAQLHASTALIGVAVADLYPRFSLTGNIGVSSGTLAGLGNLNNQNWGIGPSASWQLFSAGRVQSNILVQKALRDQSTLAYRQTVLTALGEVESALVAYAKDQERRAAQYDSVVANRRAAALSRQLYEAGQIDFLNVLNSARSLLVVEDAYSQSTSRVAADLVALYKALGGGWESNAYPATQPKLAE